MAGGRMYDERSERGGSCTSGETSSAGEAELLAWPPETCCDATALREFSDKVPYALYGKGDNPFSVLQYGTYVVDTAGNW